MQNYVNITQCLKVKLLWILNHDCMWNLAYLLIWAFDEHLKSPSSSPLSGISRMFFCRANICMFLCSLWYASLSRSVWLASWLILHRGFLKPVQFSAFIMCLWFRLNGLTGYTEYVHQRSCVSFLLHFKINSKKLFKRKQYLKIRS